MPRILKHANLQTVENQLPGLVCLEIHQWAARKATRANSGGRVGRGGNHVETLAQASCEHTQAQWIRAGTHFKLSDFESIQHEQKFIPKLEGDHS
jgi:hypothetical protein